MGGGDYISCSHVIILVINLKQIAKTKITSSKIWNKIMTKGSSKKEKLASISLNLNAMY